MKANRITACRAKKALDSRGSATLEIIITAGEFRAVAIVPSGKSAGAHEAKELRDPDGIGVKIAIDRVEKVVAPALIGKEVNRKEIDALLIYLDGTKNKSHLGGNSMIGISMATERLAAMLNRVPLWKHIGQNFGSTPAFPRLYMNMINGGVHADFRLPFQEYIVVIGKESPRLAYEKGKEIFSRLGKAIESEFGKVQMGDEGGYSPEINDIHYPFEIINNTISGEENVFLAIDAAASELFQNGSYVLKEQPYTAIELSNLYQELVNNFSLTSIEDPFAEDMTSDFSELVKKLVKKDDGDNGDTILIVGDDLTVTNPERIRTMIEKRAANAVIIKPNQIGTMTETYEAVRLAKEAGWKVIVSHRSGDTMDSFISDLTVGVGAYGLKAGSPNPPERKAKYDRLIEISEKEMSSESGKSALDTKRFLNIV